MEEMRHSGLQHLRCPWMVPADNGYRSPDSGDYNHHSYDMAFVHMQFSRPPCLSSLTRVQCSNMGLTSTFGRLVPAVPGTANSYLVVLAEWICLGFIQSMILPSPSLTFLSQSLDTV